MVDKAAISYYCRFSRSQDDKVGMLLKRMKNNIVKILKKNKNLKVAESNTQYLCYLTGAGPKNWHVSYQGRYFGQLFYSNATTMKCS